MAAVALLVGCGSADQGERANVPAPLSSDQAQALAMARFNNYAAQTVPVRVEVSGASGFAADLLLDLHDHLAFGSYRVSDPATEELVVSGVLAFDGDVLSTTSSGETADLPPPRARAWQTRVVDLSSVVDVSLLMALNLGADRPENPTLLQQSDARFLRAEGGDDPVWVMRGPRSPGASEGTTSEGRTTYWVRPGGQLVRYEARVSSGNTIAIDVLDDRSGLPTSIPRKVIGQLKAVR